MSHTPIVIADIPIVGKLNAIVTGTVEVQVKAGLGPELCAIQGIEFEGYGIRI